MENQNKILNKFGLNMDALPGFVIIFVIYDMVLELIKVPLFESLQLNVTEYTSHMIITVLSIFIALISYSVSGKLLDPIYDAFYGEEFGMWENTTHNPLFLFPRGHALKSCRRKTRNHFIHVEKEKNKKNEDSYKSKDKRGRYIESIYTPVKLNIEVENPDMYTAVLNELAWSKTARNSIFPLFIVSILVASVKAWALFTFSILLTLLLFIPYFSLRNSHQVNLYTRFNSKHNE